VLELTSSDAYWGSIEAAIGWLLIVTAIPASTNAAPNILIVVGVSPRRKYSSAVAPVGSPSKKDSEKWGRVIGYCVTIS
jgi:hypothetical protein